MGYRLEHIKSRIRSFGSIIRKRIVIIGGGASGLTAAIGGVGNGTHVTIIEHMDRVGKKILSADNGRYGLTSPRIGGDCCRCDQKRFPMEVIRGFGVDEILALFKGLGIEPKDRNGYIYPGSDQASAVLDVLRSKMERLGVAVLFSYRAEKIEPAVGGDDIRYKVYTDQDILNAGAAILAVGSKAAPPTGSDGSEYELTRRLKHRIIKPLPTLIQLRCQGSIYQQMAGVRTEAGVRLMAAGKLLGRDGGELQLTGYGLSGIPVLRVNRFATGALDQGKRVTALVDFMPPWDNSKAFGLLKKHASLLGHKTAEELPTGLLNKEPALVLIKLAGIKPSQKARDLSPEQLKLLLGQMKSYETIIMSVNPFANAQVCYGSADTREVDAVTVESGIHASLYLAGELLDVDGICGGYSLQFAWSSGMIAGVHAAGEYFAETHEANRNRTEARGAYGPTPGGKGNRK